MSEISRDVIFSEKQKVPAGTLQWAWQCFMLLLQLLPRQEMQTDIRLGQFFQDFQYALDTNNKKDAGLFGRPPQRPVCPRLRRAFKPGTGHTRQ
jgi:hypothetical protein